MDLHIKSGHQVHAIHLPLGRSDIPPHASAQHQGGDQGKDRPPFMRTTLMRLAWPIIFISTVLVYYPGLSGPFLLDDHANIFAGRQPEGISLESLAYAATNNNSGLLGRPISAASLAISRHLYGENPAGFKAENLLLHLLAGLLIAILFTKIEKASSTQPNGPFKHLALVTTGFWLLHPVQVSTVLYVVQRMSILSTIFVVLSLLSYFKMRDARNTFPYALWTTCYFISALLATLSKETGVLVVGLALLIDSTLSTNGSGFTSPAKQKIFRTLCCYIPIAAFVGIFATRFTLFMSGYHERDFTLSERLFTQTHAMTFYLKEYFFPQLSELSLYHDDFQIARKLADANWIFILGVIAALVFARKIRRHAPLVTLGLLWFLWAHILESTVLPLEMVFEHRNYLPYMGLALITHQIGTVLFAYFPRINGKIFAATAIMVLATLTNLRAHEWSSPENWLSSVIANHPDSQRATTAVAHYFQQRGNQQQAKIYLQKSARIKPDDPGVWLHLMSLYCQAPDADTQEWYAYAKLARQTISTYQLSNYAFLMLDALGNHASRNECRIFEGSEGLEILDAATQNPKVQAIPRHIALVLWTKGKLLYKKGDIDGALSEAEKAYQRNSDNIQPLISRGLWMTETGRIEEARRELRRLKTLTVNTLRNEAHDISYLADFIDKHSPNNYLLPGTNKSIR
jgi:protein O-mannosyl-transferase